MPRCIVVLFIFIVLSPVAAQSPEVEWDFPVITAENAHQLGIVRTVYSRDFPAEYRFQYATPFLFHPDGRRMVVALDRHPGIIDLQTGETSVIVQEDNDYGMRLFNMSFSQDGNLLLAIESYGFRLWNFEKQEKIMAESIDISIPWDRPATISSDNEFLFITTRSGTHVWSIIQKEEISRYPPLCDYILAGYDMVVCDNSVNQGLQRELTFIDFKTGEILSKLVSPDWSGSTWDYRLKISPDRQTIALALHNSEYTLVDFSDQEIIEYVNLEGKYEGGLVRYSLTPSGYVVAREHEQSIEILDIRTGNLLSQIPLQPPAYSVYYQFSADGTLFGVTDYANNAIDVYAVTECQIMARRVVYPRSAPGLSDDRGTIQPDKRMAVVAQEFDPVGGYLWYQLADGRWIQANIVDTSGNCEDETQ